MARLIEVKLAIYVNIIIFFRLVSQLFAWGHMECGDAGFFGSIGLGYFFFIRQNFFVIPSSKPLLSEFVPLRFYFLALMNPIFGLQGPSASITLMW